MATVLKYRVLGMDRVSSLQPDGTVDRKATMRVTAAGPLPSMGMPMGFHIPEIPADMVAIIEAGDEVILTIEKVVPPAPTEPVV